MCLANVNTEHRSQGRFSVRAMIGMTGYSPFHYFANPIALSNLRTMPSQGADEHPSNHGYWPYSHVGRTNIGYRSAILFYIILLAIFFLSVELVYFNAVFRMGILAHAFLDGSSAVFLICFATARVLVPLGCPEFSGKSKLPLTSSSPSVPFLSLPYVRVCFAFCMLHAVLCWHVSHPPHTYPPPKIK